MTIKELEKEVSRLSNRVRVLEGEAVRMAAGFPARAVVVDSGLLRATHNSREH